VREKARATIDEVDKMGAPAMLGDKFTVTGGEMKKLKTLAKKSVTADDKVRAANRRRDDAEKLCADAVAERDELKKQAAKEKSSVLSNMTVYQKLLAAFQRAPKRLLQIVEDILKQSPEKVEPQKEQHSKTEVTL
jgi:predicted membrane chloride channel (bestrophin family)